MRTESNTRLSRLVIICLTAADSTDLPSGCITADELKFVLTHLPGKVTYKEIDEMIKTVDENGDGKINYQEFRVMIGAKPNLTAAMAATHPHLATKTKPDRADVGPVRGAGPNKNQPL